ncbi:potassium/sodium hyperpolarization-activated cyclic nucleotide-gated channel 2-like isoform X2 [Choristoneura fumiferana]|uniref:potassium/sodium hyperpolarization-activated cyclic nucleotide-gated channel 2-like isoform X2 n=1 Tax=Choristoneura fumiferana TaxID=7141 RepID=UPI003D1597F1
MPKKASTYFEPCYDHNCSVWDEKDVLDVDIKGEGCFSSLKRFWYNLFLLSFTDLRAKHFYTSSHAMKVARAIHFRHYRSSIHPLSKFRSFWDFFILHIMVLNKIFIHINSSMIHDMGMSIHYAALACDALVIYDVYTMELEDAGFLFFSLELSRISKSFLLFGYGLRPNETTFDKLSALIAFVIAYTFHMWIFVGMNSCFTRLTYSEDLYITNLDRTKNILRARQMPDVMHDKVNEYYQCKISTLALTEKQNGLFGALPKALKRDIVLSCYRKHVLRLPFFADWPFDVINEIALLLQQEVFLDKDVIGNAYTQSDGLVIVESGLLAVYSVRNEETCHLVDGDYFGELSLVTDKEMRMSTIVAATSCSILFLSKQHFRKLMRDHAQLFFDMKTKLNYANNRNWEGNEVIENDINTHRP